MAIRTSYIQTTRNDKTNTFAGDVTFQKDLTIQGDLTFGNAVVDTLIMNGRMATSTIAGAALQLDSTYTYGELFELRCKVTSWSGILQSFKGYYLRAEAGVGNASYGMRGAEIFGVSNITSGTTGINQLSGLYTSAYVKAAAVSYTIPYIYSIEANVGTEAVTALTVTQAACLYCTLQTTSGLAAYTSWHGIIIEGGDASARTYGSAIVIQNPTWSGCAATTWTVGLNINEACTTGIDINSCVTGIDIGAGTTGISITGATTTAISVTGDCTTVIDITNTISATTGISFAGTATDGLIISGACGDAIHISGTNTATALHISGDQLVGILYDVDAAATDGVKMSVDDSMTLTTGINILQTGTTGVITTGIDLASGCVTGIDIGTATTGIAFTGTYSKGIDFASTTVTVDDERENAFLAIGDYKTTKTVALTDNFLAMQINLQNATNPGTAKKLVGYFSNLKTSGDAANARLKAIEGYVVVGHIVKDAHAIYGEVYYTGTPASGISNEGLGVGGTVDTTGVTGAPDGLLYGGKFRIKGTLFTGGYRHMALYVVTESSTHTGTCIENLSGATVTNMLWLKNDATCTNGIYLDGAYTNGINFAGTGTGITIGACTTGLTFTGAMTTGISVSNDLVIPKFLAVGASGSGVHWDNVDEWIEVYAEAITATPTTKPLTRITLNAISSAATTSGRLECFRAVISSSGTQNITANMRSIVGQTEFAGACTYGAGSYDFDGAYGVVAGIYSGANVQSAGNLYPLGIFFCLETGSVISGASSYIYVYNYGKVCPNSVIKVYNASTPAQPTYLLDMGGAVLGSASGPVYTGDVNPSTAPTADVLGADGHIKILVGSTPYYIPIFATLV